MNNGFWNLWFFADSLMFRADDKKLCGVSDLMRGERKLAEDKTEAPKKEGAT